MSNPALLHLMHLISPALPVGAYAYSQGLEYAIDSGWLSDCDEIAEWLTGVMENGLLYLDLPVLRRMHKAWGTLDIEQINHYNALLRACRETRELLLEDEQMGQALNRLLQSLGVAEAAPVYSQMPPGYVSQFALAGNHWQIDTETLCQGFVWSWLENQVAAATKLVPLGQTRAQQLLVALMPVIPRVCQLSADVTDDELGMSLPGLAMASSLHEHQYSRLFRS